MDCWFIFFQIVQVNKNTLPFFELLKTVVHKCKNYCQAYTPNDGSFNFKWVLEDKIQNVSDTKKQNGIDNYLFDVFHTWYIRSCCIKCTLKYTTNVV